MGIDHELSVDGDIVEKRLDFFRNNGVGWRVVCRPLVLLFLFVEFPLLLRLQRNGDDLIVDDGFVILQFVDEGEVVHRRFRGCFVSSQYGKRIYF